MVVGTPRNKPFTDENCIKHEQSIEHSSRKSIPLGMQIPEGDPIEIFMLNMSGFKIREVSKDQNLKSLFFFPTECDITNDPAAEIQLGVIEHFPFNN